MIYYLGFILLYNQCNWLKGPRIKNPFRLYFSNIHTLYWQENSKETYTGDRKAISFGSILNLWARFCSIEVFSLRQGDNVKILCISVILYTKNDSKRDSDKAFISLSIPMFAVVNSRKFINIYKHLKTGSFNFIVKTVTRRGNKLCNGFWKNYPLWK